MPLFMVLNIVYRGLKSIKLCMLLKKKEHSDLRLCFLLGLTWSGEGGGGSDDTFSLFGLVD